MRLPFVALTLVALAACLCTRSPSLALPAATPAENDGPPTIVLVTARPLTPTNAPADEYFGRLKLSNLGIRNIVHALAVEGNSPLALPLERTRIMGVHTAIVEWSDVYPRDPWLKRVVLNFTDVIVRKHDADTDRIAIDLLLLASQRFRTTPYEKVALNRANAIQLADDIDWSIPPFNPPTLADLVEVKVK